jgi:hypothetical protein
MMTKKIEGKFQKHSNNTVTDIVHTTALNQ